MFPIRDSVSRTTEPIVVWTIIGLNIAAFFYQLGMSAPELNYFLYQHALVPRRYFSPDGPTWWACRLPTSRPSSATFFLHGGWLHIIFNMWTLYIFGPALEDRLGSVRFAILYLLAGVAASATHALFNAASMVPALGASGAIAGADRCLRRALSLRLGAHSGADRFHSPILQHPGRSLRRHLVFHAADPGSK